MRKYKPIIVVAGEPNSIFLEIFFKSLKKSYTSPIILIASYKLLMLQMKKSNYKKKVKLLELENLSKYILNNKKVSINMKKELNNLIKLKTNQQLNQFSNIYFNKIKKNIKIEKI